MAVGPQAMVMHPAMALTNILTETLPMNLSLLARLPVAQDKSAFFAPHIIHSILEGLTEPTLQYLIFDELWLKGDT